MGGQIVVAVDGSAPATAAVEWAAADAARRGLDLRIVHVRRADGSARVLEAAAALAGPVGVTAEALTGNVVDTLVAESPSADSLVLGWRGLGGFTGMSAGSVSVAVAGHAAGPVVVVRTPPQGRHDRVVVGFDGSGHARAAMEYAVEQARARRARLHVVSAWQIPVSSPYAAAYGSLIEVMQDADRQAHGHVVPWRQANPDLVITEEQPCEHPVSALVRAAGTADLVVVGSRGLGGFASAVLGSVGHGVLHHAACPVAVVRPRFQLLAPLLTWSGCAGR
ncbi:MULTISPECIES: universal stress protein [unclassified Nonomuraea]|uniref:universal stress protein n=1 Tax=unclassified Nonomuraea TaxID=2593643 RepID=UPI0033D654F5